MQQATNFGSLITPTATEDEILRAQTQVQSKLEASRDLFAGDALLELDAALVQLGELARKFWCVVDNPPYMGGSKMNPALSKFIKANYPDSKSDIATCFITMALQKIKPSGYVSMVTLDSWMFLSSFEKFRYKTFEDGQIDSMLHIGWNCFPEGHTYNRGTAFVITEGTEQIKDGLYVNLSNVPAIVNKQELLEERLESRSNVHVANQEDFAKIPGSPVGYWVGEDMIQAFVNGEALGDLTDVRQGLATSNNDRFIKLWHEVSLDNFTDKATDLKSAQVSNKKWFPYNKGGDYRKWYGNQEYVVNWKNDGYEIRNFTNDKGKIRSAVRADQYYFRESLTWSFVSSKGFGIRYSPSGFIFDVGGSSMFVDEGNAKLILGFLISKPSIEYLSVFSPTINFQVGDLKLLPILEDKTNRIQIDDSVGFCINASKEDWDSSEESWNFEGDKVVKDGVNKIYDAIQIKEANFHRNFFGSHSKEESINLIYISLYGLSNILDTRVDLQDITILQNELDRKALAKLNTQLKRDPTTGLVTNYDELELPFKRDVILQQFISYAVGCMMGRYSLDKEGLILANAGDTLTEYAEKIGKEAKDWAFAPDEDGIIPVLQDDFFDDDIVNRFEVFLRTTFGDDHYSENLDFVEECIGKDIRSYFLKDFFDDHVKRYKKRPIYWIFVSPGGHFRALVYLHRYRSDIISRLLNDYLRDYVRKLEAARGNAIVTKSDERLAVSIRTDADKNIQRYEAALLDCREYATNILQPLAARKLELDLDDGVLVNYNKMGKAVEMITNMNDAKGRKKVMAFDWVDFDWEA
jgi:hypothetical protein